MTLRNYRKNGELFHYQLMVKPLNDDHGNVVYFLGAQYDIMEQVNARRKIEKLSKELKLTVE